MKIHSLAKIISFPFEIAALVILYFMFIEGQEDLFPYLLPLVIFIVIIYTFSPKVNYAWHKKNPPPLDTKIKDLVFRASPFFQSLGIQGKQKFLDRLSIFINHKAFYMMREEREDLPFDIKALIACNAITLTFNQEGYFFKKYDYFVAYQHPFPSPKIPNLHTVEVDHEDGVMLFDADQLLRSTVLKTSLFNTGLYAFAVGMLHYESEGLGFSQFEEPDLGLLKEDMQLPLDRIYVETGYKELNTKAVVISLFFTHRIKVQKYYPELFAYCMEYFEIPSAIQQNGA